MLRFTLPMHTNTLQSFCESPELGDAYDNILAKKFKSQTRDDLMILWRHASGEERQLSVAPVGASLSESGLLELLKHFLD